MEEKKKVDSGKCPHNHPKLVEGTKGPNGEVMLVCNDCGTTWYADAPKKQPLKEDKRKMLLG